MTQPSASDSTPQHTPGQSAMSGDQVGSGPHNKAVDALESASKASQTKHAKNVKDKKNATKSPVIRHPNFDPTRIPIDPDRPLSDIPDPAPRRNAQLRHFYGRLLGKLDAEQLAKQKSSQKNKVKKQTNLSKWDLIESEALADHLALLSAGQLIELPPSFYHNHSEQPLLSSLSKMTFLDMADISEAIRAYPTLTRYGLRQAASSHNREHLYASPESQHSSADSSEISQTHASSPYQYDADELLNTDYADTWEVLLYPERFDGGIGSLQTDVVACSVAVHAMSQCDTRKSINTNYSAADICQYLRSYLLSEANKLPFKHHQYRQIRLFPGHVIVAAHHLGWSIQQNEIGKCYFNISSRCPLLARYPNLTEYYINGWSNQLT